MLRRTGYHLPMICGFTAIAIGLVMLAVHPPAGFPAYWWLAAWSMLTGLGMGVSAPATNNATLQLAPDQVAAIAGQRGMFRQSGGIIYISIATALLAHGATPEIQAMIQAHIFIVQAAILVVMMSLVFRVPNHKGTW
jgi:MFS family permease